MPNRYIRRSVRVVSHVEQASSRPRRVRLSDAQPPPRLVCRYEYISRHDNASNQHCPSDSRAAPHNRPPMFIHAQQPPTSRFPLLLFPVYAIVYIVIFVIICARAVIFRYESPKRPVFQDRYFHFYVWLSCRAGFYHVAYKCACSPAMSSYVVLVSNYVVGGGVFRKH